MDDRLRDVGTRKVAIAHLILALSTVGVIPSAFAAPGEVLSHQLITAGSFPAQWDSTVSFGSSVASLGDLDGDGVGDLAVGDDGDDIHGAVWVLFLNANGTVRGSQKISATEGGFTGTLDLGDLFGTAVASLGDLNGDGLIELAVSAPGDDDKDGPGDQINFGAVWILSLNADGTVESHQKISDTQGGFTGGLLSYEWFGTSLAAIGDLDGDGQPDLAVGSPRRNETGPEIGTVWVLFLNADGTVKAHQKINISQGGFEGELDLYDRFGTSLAWLGDFDGAGGSAATLAVGARGDDDGGFEHGAVWILFLNADGTVLTHQKISDTAGGFDGQLDDADEFGVSVASLGDLDGNGVGDLAVGARGDDDSGLHRGAVWILFLNSIGTVVSHQKITEIEGGFTGVLYDQYGFGQVLGALGDHDNDGVPDMAVGSPNSLGGVNGEVWILFLDGVAECPADIDGGGDVGIGDFLLVLAQWGPCPPDCFADVDGDGEVGILDLLLVLADWGPCT